VLSIGIVGLPNVGKSTLFNALTSQNILAANYPFATIEPNTGIVPVPDERLDKLADIFKSQNKIPATVNFVDIAGLVAGASQGEGLGNQFLANIRSCDAICHVVRAFNDPNVQHIDNKPNPARDIEIVNTELALADLQTIQKRLPLVEKETKANPKLLPMLNNLQQAEDSLNKNIALSQSTNIDLNHLKDLQLLSVKPVIYLFNIDDAQISDEKLQSDLSQIINPAKALFVCAKLESELSSLDKSEQDELLQTYGLNEPGLMKLVKNCYEILGLQSFYTAGEKESRAWTIKRGYSAPQAAGVIHSDFQKGFIAAQIVSYQDLIDSGSLIAAKSAGKVRTEGKDYIMKPDDVVEFRFNV
jgi:GTP-binding protein YchF